MDNQKTQIAYTTLKEKNKVGEMTLLNFETYFKAIIIKKCGIGERINK